KWIDKQNLNCLIEVDGGINAETGAKCRKAGVDILVAGSYLYGHDDIKERVESLR
ncbi:MAG: ribulose-phosphate 3-epimerase, partial [Bacilli bacterium]|nr:ribulose-phosphate 3-epimerase [Bacilli bacterium]